MPYPLDKAIWSNIFAVPCDVADRHIKLCSDTALRVLLLLLRHGGNLDRQTLARMLGKAEADIQDALDYWQQVGVLEQPESLAMQAVSSVAAPAPAAESVPVLHYEHIEEPGASTSAATAGTETRRIETLSKNRARLTTREIGEMAQQDENIAYLLQEAQSVLGKPLSPIATDTIAALYSYYGMQPDLVLMLLQYCVTMGKDNMRYVEKVAATWLENGVDTHEKAEREILRATEISTVEHRIKMAFGIYDRKLVASEQKYIGVWTGEFLFDVDMIALAFERAVEQKGKLSFPYINGILSNWHAKGLKTPAQAIQEMQEKNRSAAVQNPAKSSGKASYDMDELEQLITYQKLV